jgi:beta-fructofuranosidase
MNETQRSQLAAISSEEFHTARHMRHKMLGDPYRPTYHFVAPEGLGGPFDPNGNICWRGRHHMGFIYHERGVDYWGHVSSLDLLHWRHHVPMLLPTLDSPEKGIYSGNAFVDKDGRRAIALYHGCGEGNSIAWSDDDNLDNWHKQEGNPIVPNPADPDKADFASWDPCGWIEGDTYYAVFGGKKNTVWKSTDLRNWKMCGPFLAEAYPGIDLHEDISCPDFFPMGDKWVMVCISHRLGARYYVGTWKNERFHPEYHEMMSFCDNEFFAPESHTDARGRRILFAWVFDGRNPPVSALSGWCGTMSLPRMMTLGPDNRLLMTPVEELTTLRYNPVSAANIAIPADSFANLEFPCARRPSLAAASEGGSQGWPPPTIEGFRAVEPNVYEIEAVLHGGTATEFGLELCCSADGSEATRIGYDVTQGKLKIDTNRTGQSQRKKTLESAPMKLAAGEPLKLRVFVDRSVVEVFANDGRQALCRSIYPSKGSTGIRLYAQGGGAKAESIRAWDIMPTNPY